jgi:hypothetical protein
LVTTSKKLTLFFSGFLRFQKFHVFFHTFHHPSFEKKHKECNDRHTKIESPFIKTNRDTIERNYYQGNYPGSKPKVEHNFIIELHKYFLTNLIYFTVLGLKNKMIVNLYLNGIKCSLK